MTWTVRAVTTPALAQGFRLAGVEVLPANDAAEAASLLAASVEQPSLGVLVVEQRLLDAIPDATRRDLERRPVPILVPVPDAAWGEHPADAESLILQLLRRAIGYQVKLR